MSFRRFIEYKIVVVCLFFGFIGYGMLGEQLFHNSLYGLKNISPESIVRDIKNQFEELNIRLSALNRHLQPNPV